MKKFILNLAVFSLIISAGFIAYFLVISNLSLKTAENYRFGKNINKLIAGDSRTQYSINDKILNNSRNISQNSEGLLYTYYKLKLLLKNNPEIDTVLLGVSYHTFSSYYADIRNKPEVSGRYFFVLPVTEQLRSLTDTKNTLPLIQFALSEGTKNLYNNKPDTTLLGGYDCYTTTKRINDSVIADRINFQFFEGGRERELFEENIIYFNKIAELCKERNIRLIIINTPMHKQYSAKVPAKFKNELRELIKNNGLYEINFDTLILSDADFLPDGDHLQESGAKLTSDYLNKLLNREN